MQRDEIDAEALKDHLQQYTADMKLDYACLVWSHGMKIKDVREAEEGELYTIFIKIHPPTPPSTSPPSWKYGAFVLRVMKPIRLSEGMYRNEPDWDLEPPGSTSYAVSKHKLRIADELKVMDESGPTPIQVSLNAATFANTYTSEIATMFSAYSKNDLNDYWFRFFAKDTYRNHAASQNMVHDQDVKGHLITEAHDNDNDNGILGQDLIKEGVKSGFAGLSPPEGGEIQATAADPGGDAIRASLALSLYAKNLNVLYIEDGTAIKAQC